MVSRTKNRLTATNVKNAGVGTHHDGGGLYLKVTPSRDGKSLRRQWLFRYWDGKSRWMGLGSTDQTTLKQAREAADEARRLRPRGVDPIAARDAEREAATAVQRRFSECVTEFIDAHEGAWKNSKHRQQWRNTLETYAHPIVGDKPVGEVTCEDLISVLKSLSGKAETAERVRARMLRVMIWCVAMGYRSAAKDDPTTWVRRLHTAVPIPSKSKRVEHHAALPYEHIPEFVTKLRGAASISARALEFLILTAARTNEVLDAQWSEFDLEKAIWIVPAERMKAGREHRVPLCQRAIAILAEMKAAKNPRWVFVGPRKKPLSSSALLMMVRRTASKQLTTHGLRSSFRDWAAEETPFSREVAEQALAHTIADKTEAAYRRGDLFEKRRLMMVEWSSYCASKLTSIASCN